MSSWFTLPTSSNGQSFISCGASITRCSIFSSSSSVSFLPAEENTFIPLNSALLCEPDIIIPALAPYSFTRKATAGVGTTPTSSASAPTEQTPAHTAASRASDEALVSLPIMILAFSPPFFASTTAAARPVCMASSQVRSVTAIPLGPSVPKSFGILCSPCSFFIFLMQLCAETPSLLL